jgi:hypothetical protein
MRETLAALVALATLFPISTEAADSRECPGISRDLDAMINIKSRPLRVFTATSALFREIGASAKDYQEACAAADGYFQHYTKKHELERRFVFECNGTLRTIGGTLVNRTNVRENAAILKPFWQDKAEICDAPEATTMT